jgi:hypothetical protein
MADLSEILRFRPWWLPDPAPPWLLNQLEKNQLIQLAKISIELNQTVLQAQQKAAAQAHEIINSIQSK